MILYDAIMYKYPDAIPKKDFVLRNDGNGSYIEEWNLRTPIPSEEELQLWWEESKKESALYAAKLNRVPWPPVDRGEAGSKSP